MEAFLAQAGASKDDLIHVFIFIPARGHQQNMLDTWIAEFPVDGDRPARKAIFDETLARDDQVIHLLCVAVTDEGQRFNLEVPGISKNHPNPMGCRVGTFVFSSGIGGNDPSGKETSNDTSLRTALALSNARTLLETGGGGLSDIGMVSITVNDYADEEAILRRWHEFFPDPADQPARHIMAFGGRGSYPVQLHVIAALNGR
jgi:2-iminobutanoate/2-iminopropanoate deaminase